MTSPAVPTWFLRAWWFLVPPFAVLVVRLVYERGCAAPYELLPQLTTNALLAWPLASMYLAVHCWAVAAYLITVQRTGALLPNRAAAKSLWNGYWPMVLFTIAILALEYSPIPFWRWVGQSVCQAEQVRSDDLIAALDGAERRPASARFEVADISINGESRRAIATESISRVTWQLSLPDKAVLETAIALKPEAWTQPGNGVLFRIGIAEGRTYEELFTRVVDPFHVADDRRWISVTIDLARYSGSQWSLFYHPARLTWRLIFNTNSGPPGTDDRAADLPLWGQPVVKHYR